MEEVSIIQWIVQQAGMAGIAAFALVMLNRVWESRVEAEKKRADEINQMRSELLGALERNTKVITQLVERFERLDKTPS
jgi:hypothetical protein